MERPLRVRYELTEETLAAILAEKAVQKFLSLPAPSGQLALDPAQNHSEARLVAALRAAASTPTTDERVLGKSLDAALREAGLPSLPTPARKAIMDALAVRDETAPPALGPKGALIPDPDLRDSEDVPLDEEIAAYMAREVTPHLPDAWVNESLTDPIDKGVGKVGYKINFNRYFYQYQPPRPLAEIDAELRVLEQEIAEMLREVTA